MQSARRKVAKKYPHIMTVRCIAHHINLITKDIISIEWAKKILQSCQKVVSFFHNVHLAGSALRNKIESSFSKRNLKSSVKTRWSTAWDVCDSILHLENNIKLVSIYKITFYFLYILDTKMFYYSLNKGS